MNSVATLAPPALEWVHAPQQARSRETLERLLDAAEAVLADKSVERASVAEIARRAGSSVGAFYARFHDKEGLLRTLFQRFDEQADATARVALEPARWEGVPLVEALRTLLGFLVRVLHDKRGLIAAMVARMPTDPALGLLGERLLARVTELVLGLLRARGAGTRHPDPERAVHLVVWLVLGALELRAVASLHAPPRLGDEATAHELAELCVRYLGVEDPVLDRVATASPRARAATSPARGSKADARRPQPPRTTRSMSRPEGRTRTSTRKPKEQP